MNSRIAFRGKANLVSAPDEKVLCDVLILCPDEYHTELLGKFVELLQACEKCGHCALCKKIAKTPLRCELCKTLLSTGKGRRRISDEDHAELSWKPSGALTGWQMARRNIHVEGPPPSWETLNVVAQIKGEVEAWAEIDAEEAKQLAEKEQHESGARARLHRIFLPYAACLTKRERSAIEGKLAGRPIEQTAADLGVGQRHVFKLYEKGSAKLDACIGSQGGKKLPPEVEAIRAEFFSRDIAAADPKTAQYSTNPNPLDEEDLEAENSDD